MTRLDKAAERWNGAKRLLLTAEGRIQRWPYWFGFIVLFVFEIPLMFAPSAIEELGYLVLYYPSVCLYTKRLHDLGRSGWWQLISWIVTLPLTLQGWAVAAAAVQHGEAAAAQLERQHSAEFLDNPVLLVGTAVGFAFSLYLGIARGQPISNRYGRTPNMVGVEDVF